MIDNFKEQNGVLLQGHIKIHDPDSGEIFVNKRNAIHYEKAAESADLGACAYAGKQWHAKTCCRLFGLEEPVHALIKK